MKSLDLLEIVKLRQDLKCREGLVIDFDYGACVTNFSYLLSLTRHELFSLSCLSLIHDPRSDVFTLYL
jgi:hypothetical protein